MGLKTRPQWIRPCARWIKDIKKAKKISWKQGNPSSTKLEENILEYSSFGLGYNFSSCCYSVFFIDFPIPSFWRVSYIIYLHLDDPGPLFVDCLIHYLSACPIRYLLKPFMTWGNQHSTIHGSSPRKCN